MKLFRLQDQYLEAGAAIAAGIVLQEHSWWIIWWGIATTLLSMSAFMFNELIDRQDVDKLSWNWVHVPLADRYDIRILVALYATTVALGLGLSAWLGLFWWGLAAYLIGVFYSLKPIRLKTVFGLDILTQLLGSFVVPFLGPLVLKGVVPDYLTAFLISISCFIIAGFFGYQLADYQADAKMKFWNTHLVLGMKNSLIFGLVLLVIGVGTFIYFDLYRLVPWLTIFIPLSAGIGYWYLRSLSRSSVALQSQEMQLYVKKVKPITQLFVPYLLLWWLFF